MQSSSRRARWPWLLVLLGISGLAVIAPRASLAETVGLKWKASTQSPRPAAAPDAQSAPLHALCGANDPALAEVAAQKVSRQLEGSAYPADELAFGLRAAGDPHVWPRGWAISGGALDEADVARRVKLWASNTTTLGVRRCGVARATQNGLSVIAAISVDALADMSPLPTTARVGQWITLEGTMLVPATAAKVVLLGPRGAPKTVVASLTGSRVRSSFSVDDAGAWLVQVLATVSTGPRPVLEAMVFAGVTPPSRFVRSVAPGEDAAKGAKDDADAMLQMMNAARATEQLGALRRDPELDKLARAHSEEMLKARMVGHDVGGGGDVAARIQDAGIVARVAGENVASASTLENAHRVLWGSPSHRGNLLFARFVRVGVAVSRGADGTVWVTEIFAG